MRGLGSGRAVVRLSQPILENLDARRQFLKEPVDIILVVAPQLLAELHFSKGLRFDFHGLHGTAIRARRCGPLVEHLSQST